MRAHPRPARSRIRQNAGTPQTRILANAATSRQRIEPSAAADYNCAVEFVVEVPRPSGRSLDQHPMERVVAVQIKISARHGHLADATQQFIHDKAMKSLHIYERLTMIEVTVDLQKEPKEVKFRVQVENKH